MPTDYMQMRPRSVVFGANPPTTYVLASDPFVELVDSWADPIRVVGSKSRRDLTKTLQRVWEDWSYGLGFYSAQGESTDNPLHPSFFGFYDSSVETRFQGQVTLPGLIQTVSAANNHAYYRMFVAPAPGTVNAVYALSFTTAQSIASKTGTTFSQYKDLSTYTNFIPRCAIPHNGSTYILGGTDSAVPSTVGRIGPDGIWADLTPATNFSGYTPHSGVSLRDIMYVACVAHAGGLVQIWQSSDDGANWTTAAGFELSITRSNVAELFLHPDANGPQSIYLKTGDGVYIIGSGLEQDIIPVFQFRNALLPSLRDRARPVNWNGATYIPHGGELRYFGPDATSGWPDVSPFTTARTPSTYGTSALTNFQITALCDAGNWLFVGVSSGSAVASVWAYDGRGWHFIWKVTGTGITTVSDIIVSQTGSDDTSDTLYIVYNDTSGATTANFNRVEDILSNPLENTAHKYASSGILVVPWQDGGLPDVKGPLAAFGMSMTGNTADETIQNQVALDYSETYQSAPNVLTWASTSSLRQRYADGLGLSHRSFRNKLTLSRGSTNTYTPVLFHGVSYYEKLPGAVYQFTFEIDIPATLRDRAGSNNLAYYTALDIVEDFMELADSKVYTLIRYAGVQFQGLPGSQPFASEFLARVINMKYVDILPNSSGTLQSKLPAAGPRRLFVVAETRG